MIGGRTVSINNGTIPEELYHKIKNADLKKLTRFSLEKELRI